MATNSLVLFQLGTLCFVLLMLMPAAHGKQARGVLVIYGTARCKSNPSRTINNATLQVTISGTMVATGETSSSGLFALVANVTSRSQLVALVTKEAVITAPPQACGGGGPAAAAPAVRNRKMHAAAAGLMDASDSDDVEIKIGDIGILAVDSNAFDKIVHNAREAIESLGIFVIADSGLDVYSFLETIDDFLGIPQEWSRRPIEAYYSWLQDCCTRSGKARG